MNRQPSIVRKWPHALGPDQNDVQKRLTNIEDGVGQMSIVLRQLSKQMESTQAKPNSMTTLSTLPAPANLPDNDQQDEQLEKIMKRLR